MALQASDQVSVYVSLTREYCLTEDAATVATAMGVSLDTLAGILDGADWEPEESTIAAMAEKGDIESEEWECSEITES